ncbi:hypothetical protein [Aquibacillus rhizosphaerae]|uniref:Uncharacterized protein n=1 Tax=Aquibacillus rhizosphaerae TaxID=3051431 RepID=A0ABT7L291_9BACI|nr:hypothetical protein [Aquibacillus sp. LR5S19]MDL4839969.1 hypothetical protein [Aquibacillus sp. LR5S19]
MKKENFNLFVTIVSMLTIIGLILLFFSTHFGTSMADNWLMEQGGADTAMFHIRIKSYINNFLVSGGILFGIGLFTLFLTYFIKLTFIKE